MNKLAKYLVALAVVAFLAVPAFTMPVSAENDPYGIGAVNGEVNLSSDVDPQSATTNIINLALSFLALIALVIILIGGFKWMTAGGNEDKVGEAKKLIGAGVVGLVIVLAAWGIAIWLITTTQDVMNDVTVTLDNNL